MVNSQDGAPNHCYHHHLYRGNDCRTVVHGVEELKNSCFLRPFGSKILC